MAIQETIKSGRKYRKCIDNTLGNKKWERYSFWTKSTDVEFSDGTTAESKLGSYKGITTNENQVAGYAADITLVKSVKTSLTNLITSLTNLVNSINDRLGGMRFYEDSTGKYVIGADSVPKKLGSAELDIITVGNTNTSNRVSFDIKALYSGYDNITTANFAFASCDSTKNGSQGQNDHTRHWYSLGYDSATGILTCIPHYREWGPSYDRSGEGYGWGPDVGSPILLFAPKL